MTEFPKPFTCKVNLTIFQSREFLRLFRGVREIVRAPPDIMVENSLKAPCPIMGKYAMMHNTNHGTEDQWEWLRVFCVTHFQECWGADWIVTNYREVNALQSIYHVDFLAVAGAFLIGIVVDARSRYVLKLLKNPLYGTDEVRSVAPETLDLVLEKGDMYCLFGPSLRVPHCPKGDQRTVYLIGGHSMSDLQSGKTKRIHNSLLLVQRYYHYKERNGKIVHSAPRNVERA